MGFVGLAPSTRHLSRKSGAQNTPRAVAWSTRHGGRECAGVPERAQAMRAIAKCGLKKFARNTKKSASATSGAATAGRAGNTGAGCALPRGGGGGPTAAAMQPPASLPPETAPMAHGPAGAATKGQGHTGLSMRIQVVLSSVYLSKACSDLSRPIPDCL